MVLVHQREPVSCLFASSLNVSMLHAGDEAVCPSVPLLPAARIEPADSRAISAYYAILLGPLHLAQYGEKRLMFNDKKKQVPWQ